MRLASWVTGYGVLGEMPDGSWQLFVSEGEYADAYFDAYYELNNEFEIELPEVA